ncbi:MAG: LCP family protein [Chitinivibrionales bacterium]|nr:LCP family protein [Chitinivibrionales bacterium]
MRGRKKSWLRFIGLIIVGSAVVWQGRALYTDLRVEKAMASVPTTQITINGMVKQPGVYQVPVGTTYFEILKVAGVTSTSDLTPFMLSSQLEPNQNLSVDTLKSPVGMKPDARLEFFFGDLSILSADGTGKTVSEGLMIEEGDRVLIEEKSQAEISINNYSRIDMDNFSELTFDKISRDEAGNKSVRLFQKTGVCWYKLLFSDKKETYKVQTPIVVISLGGKNSDFTVDVKFDEMTVSCYDGLLLIERPDGSEAMNIIAGQSVTIYNDGRPFTVSKLAEGDNSAERFNLLIKTKAEMIVKHMPLNIFMVVSPQTFYCISLQNDFGIARIVRLPADLSVQLFVQGFTTLQEAFLYGGPVFSSTLIERILNMRIPNYIVFEKDDIARTVASIGGVKVIVDEKASAFLNMKKGIQLIDTRRLFDFLQPSLSGVEDSHRRQVAVLKSIFEEILSKNIIVTSLLAEQILTNVETNMKTVDVVRYYQNLLGQKKWTFKDFVVPTYEKKVENRTIYEPVMEKVKDLFAY